MSTILASGMLAAVGGGSEWSRLVCLTGRSITHAIRFAMCRAGSQGKRLLMLTDSMVAILALTRGRSSSAGILRVPHKFAALSSGAGLCMHLRWIPIGAEPGRPLVQELVAPGLR